MTKPIIGVMPLFDEEKKSIWMLPEYFEGIQFAGGIPLMLPRSITPDDFTEIDKHIDGYLFTGGQDISPELYNEAKTPQCGKIDYERDSLEKIVFNTIKYKKPILGICRGLQLINVLLGGTLYQDIPTQLNKKIEHQMTAPYDRAVHNVHITEDSMLFDIVKSPTLGVNSYHHQGIKDLAPSLTPSAVSDDGLIEAVESSDGSFLLALQWHPEFSFKTDDASAKIFNCFVNGCK